ncbi:unnamed protein product [Cylicocyclus nassatus]|uniref:ShKT domain-containing protein n=1 Tax=Cylicocyclus nassatus TaxID=53992 RepID=A0AA36H534_CYLNA|nr:unnamed protein product [Cylicocyclus nassatus]
MLQIFVFATMCFLAHGQTFTACQNATQMYTEKAFACEDKLDKESCKIIYPDKNNGQEPAVGNNIARPDACWSNDKGNSKNNKAVKTAVSLCPKRCALCCKSAAFDCEDNNRFDCSNAKQYCKNSVMKAELDLANNCPKTCGLCEEKNAGCTDSVAGCDKSLCYHPNFADAMKKQCKRTCGFCDETATTTQNGIVPTSASKEVTTTIPCGADKRCPKWKNNGFCENKLYTDEYKRKFCGRLCNMC